MNECFSRNFVLNGELRPADMFDPSLVYEGESVYEVLRMRGGTPFFFNDHMERLAASAGLRNRTLLASPSEIREQIIRLSRSDRRKEVNLKIVFNYNRDKENSLVYFIEPIYPTEVQYREGVKGILFHAERIEPGSKVINHSLRTSIYHRLILESAYEAVLVNSRNLVTEGSRSNIFFVIKNELVTAPETVVLGGITRKHILDICTENAIRVHFECIDASTLGDYDAAFMTGTSPIVLPFRSIGHTSFDVSVPLIRNLRELYVWKAELSTRNFRSAAKF